MLSHGGSASLAMQGLGQSTLALVIPKAAMNPISAATFIFKRERSTGGVKASEPVANNLHQSRRPVVLWPEFKRSRDGAQAAERRIGLACVKPQFGHAVVGSELGRQPWHEDPRGEEVGLGGRVDSCDLLSV